MPFSEVRVRRSRTEHRRAGLPESVIRRAEAVDDKPDLSSAASAKEEGWQLFRKNINNAFLGGVSTAEPHGTPQSGAPEKYPKLLGSKPKRPEARG